MSRLAVAPIESNANNSADAIRLSRDRIWEHRLVWILLFSILGLWCYFFLIGRVDSKLTSEIVKQFRKEFPGHFVSIDRAHFQAGQSITIEGIRIARLRIRDCETCYDAGESSAWGQSR